MKKRYLLILCLSIFALLFTIGGAVWFAPIKLGNISGKPSKNNRQVLTFVGAPSITDPFYYGGKANILAGAIQNQEGAYVTNGTYEADTKIATSSTSSADPISVTVTVYFYPSDSDMYEPISTTVTGQMKTVATYNSQYYTTIDDALTAANTANSGTVYSLPLGNAEDALAKTAKTITTTTEIKSGVTLAVPYATDAMDTTISYVLMTASSDYRVCAYGNTKYLLNQIYVAENLALKNSGIINISGEISGGNGGNYAVGKDYASSVTAGRHGQINLEANATITNTNTINCYGFISETSKDNGSQVIMESGTATVVFSVGEHRGGSMYFGMIDPANAAVAKEIGDAAVSGISGNGQYTPDTLQLSPFNRFYIASITAKTTVKYNATLTGLADLQADSQENVTTVSLVNNSSALITLKDSSSYVEAKYNSTNHHMDLDIYGNMVLKPMSLSLKVTKTKSSITTTIEITLSTGAVGESEGIFFPICDYFDITLNAVNGSGSADLTGQKIKLLPGAKLTVGKGVTVNARSIAVYKDNSLFANGHDKHYATSTPAELTVNGTLNTVDLGGTVKSNDDSAVLKISTDNYTVSQEVKSVTTGLSTDVPVLIVTMSMGYTGINYFSTKEATLTANGDTVSRDGATLPVGEYNVLNGKWYSKTKVISYNANGGTFSTAPSNKTYTVNGGYTIQENDLPTVTPTREHYTFKRWTLNGENPVGQVTYVNAELVAEWTPIDYDINYVISTDLIDTTGITSTPTNTNPATYNGDSSIVLVSPTWEKFIFDGWYLDEELTQKINLINGAEILKDVTGEHPITLYGAWLEEGTEIYEITYVVNNSDDVVQSSLPESEEVVSTKLDSYTTPAFDKYNGDPTYNKYFLGWYIDEAFATPFDKAQHLTQDITLYAQWQFKYHFILNESNGIDRMEVYLLPSQISSGLNLSTYLSSLESTASANNNTVSESTYFAGWATSNTNDASQKITTLQTTNFTTQDADGCLTCNIWAIWADKCEVQVKVQQGSNSGTTPSITVKISETKGGTAYYTSSTINTDSVTTYYVMPNHYVNISGSNIDSGNSGDNLITSNVTLTVTGAAGSCIAAGTLITLADGTQKKVEDVVETDTLLVFDHETGKYVEAAITFIERDGWAYYNIINLEFSNGTKSRLIYEHGLFDLTLNKYVYIDEYNYQSFIGHEFAMIGENGSVYETVTLEKAYVTNEYTGCFSLVTVYHLNYFIDGLFSMPGGISGLFNYFEYGEGLKYDEEQMQADIEKYGLYTYEDFEGHIPYEIYEYVFPAKYYKISVGKGMLTWEEILQMIERYLVKNGVM